MKKNIYIHCIFQIYIAYINANSFFDFVLFFIVFGYNFFWCLETQTQQLNSALVVLKQVQIIKKQKQKE